VSGVHPPATWTARRIYPTSGDLYEILIAVVAILAFPASSVLAVSQVVRDESDACCVSFSNGWNADSSNNGYDNNTRKCSESVRQRAFPQGGLAAIHQLARRLWVQPHAM